MNIYYVSRTNCKICWDEFDSFVCIAEDENSARKTAPCSASFDEYGSDDWENDWNRSWTSDIESLDVVLLGVSHETEPRVVCASFNAG